MLHPLRLICLFLFALTSGQSLLAQSTCGEEDPFLVPPSRVYCTDTAGVAHLYFTIRNLGEPGDYKVHFPDGADSLYYNVADGLTIEHPLYFECGTPPGSPTLPSDGSPFYSYSGELTILRTDCVDASGDPQRGSFDFDVIPNPLKKVRPEASGCQALPYVTDLIAETCQDDVVSRFDWYLDGTLVGSTVEPVLPDFEITAAGEYTLRVEVSLDKENCGPFFLEETFTVEEQPSLTVGFDVDSTTLCAPVVTITTATSGRNISKFAWSSESPDVSFSDPASPSPLITVDNNSGGTRIITLLATSPDCGTLTETFALTTYVDQPVSLPQSLSICAGEGVRLCDAGVSFPPLHSIRWSSDESEVILTASDTECPEIIAARAGSFQLTATGLDGCQRAFSETITIVVRPSDPLELNLSAVDTLCDTEGPVDLLDYISPRSSVENISGRGVTGTLFHPAGLRGDVPVEITDSCGAVYGSTIHVLIPGGFAGGSPTICTGETIDLNAVQAGSYTGPGVMNNVFYSGEIGVGKYQITYESTAYCGGAGVFIITVEEPPVANFAITTPACGGAAAGGRFSFNTPITLVNQSDNRTACFTLLETGDEFCNVDSATFIIPQAGTYTLQQVVLSDGSACADTLLASIEVMPELDPRFELEVIGMTCDSADVRFSSRDLPDGVVPRWSVLGGQEIAAAPNFVHRLPRPVSEQVTEVQIEVGNDCHTIVEALELEIPRRFQVAFGILNDNRTVCSGDSVFLVDNSVGAQQLTTYFPNGSNMQGLPTAIVVHNPTDEILAYPIILRGSDEECAPKSVTDTLFVLPVTTRAAFNLSYDDKCSPGAVKVVNLSSLGSRGVLDWGDGSTLQRISAGDTLSHSYEVGMDTAFTIQLVADLCGQDTFSVRHEVFASPGAGFEVVGQGSQCVSDSLQFRPLQIAEGSSVDWDFGDGHFSQHSNPVHHFQEAGKFYVSLEVTNMAGCVASDTLLIAVTEYDGAGFTVRAPTELCEDNPLEMSVGGFPNRLTYDYGNGMLTDSAVSRPYSQAGYYVLRVTDTDRNGCQADTTLRIQVVPGFNLLLQPLVTDTLISLGESIELSFLTSPVRQLSSVRWSGEQVSNPESISTEVMPLRTTTYTVEAKDAYGCTASDSLLVLMRQGYAEGIYTPNVFSPNGDGRNEKFNVFARPNIVQSVRSMRVLSRWGSMVYECTDCGSQGAAAGWDGQVAGEPAKPGVYIWTAEVEFVDGVREVFRGDVTLLR